MEDSRMHANGGDRTEPQPASMRAVFQRILRAFLCEGGATWVLRKDGFWEGIWANNSRPTQGKGMDQNGFGFSIGLSRQINPFIFVFQSVMTYRVETTSIGGFIQQMAVSCVAKGYFFYVAVSIPRDKDPRAIDQKLIDRYGIDISKWARARRKQAGQANLRYLRFERFFVILATHGQHPFFAAEAACIKDIRRTPIKFAGYSVSYRDGHPHVRIEQEEYKQMKAYFLDVAVHRSLVNLEQEFAQLNWEPYAPVRRQLLSILRAVNSARRQAGFEPVTNHVFRFKRRVYRPFDPNNGQGEVMPLLATVVSVHGPRLTSG
jgi:hypothetical protein